MQSILPSTRTDIWEHGLHYSDRYLVRWLCDGWATSGGTSLSRRKWCGPTRGNHQGVNALTDSDYYCSSAFGVSCLVRSVWRFFFFGVLYVVLSCWLFSNNFRFLVHPHESRFSLWTAITRNSDSLKSNLILGARCSKREQRKMLVRWPFFSDAQQNIFLKSFLFFTNSWRLWQNVGLCPRRAH